MPEDKELVERVLGKPVFLEFSENVQKLKRNLLVLSAISLVITLGDVSIIDGSRFAGLKLKNLTDDLISTVLIFFNSYMLIHFIWAGFDGFLEWRLRLTGTKQIITGGGGQWGHECEDSSENPRDSTLYNWWLTKTKQIGSHSEKLNQIENELKDWEEKAKKAIEEDDGNKIAYASGALNNATNQMLKLQQSYDAAVKTITSNRIPVSLSRFDKDFKFFLLSQNIRWLIFEWFFPIVTGSFAIWLLGLKFYS